MNFWSGVQGGLRWGFFSWVSSSTSDLGETILGFVRIFRRRLGGVIQREFMEEMTMFMAFATTKGDMLIIEGLGPFHILVI
jgi:hypothetical protein